MKEKGEGKEEKFYENGRIKSGGYVKKYWDSLSSF